MIGKICEIIFSHSEAIVTGVGIYIAFRQTSKDKRIETYLMLKATFRDLWCKVTAHPEDNHILLEKEICEIEDENMKLIIYQTLDLFNDVYYYYSKTGQCIIKSDWQNKMTHVINTNLFSSAFRKHQFTYNLAFRTYIQERILIKPLGVIP